MVQYCRLMSVCTGPLPERSLFANVANATVTPFQLCTSCNDLPIDWLCRQPKTEELIKTYSCCLYPGSSLLQHDISGAWTEDERYFKRGMLNGRDVLRLKHVWWLDINATFKACFSLNCLIGPVQRGPCNLKSSHLKAFHVSYLLLILIREDCKNLFKHEIFSEEETLNNTTQGEYPQQLQL